MHLLAWRCTPQAAAGSAAQAQASAAEACSAANLARAAAEEAAAALLQTKQAELQAASLLRGSSASSLLKACTTAFATQGSGTCSAPQHA